MRYSNYIYFPQLAIALRQYSAHFEVGAYPIFYTGLASGLRQGELVTLSWTAFDFDHHRLILPRRWVKEEVR